LVNTNDGRVQKRARNWTIDRIEIENKKIEKQNFDILVDDLSTIFYTYAVNQSQIVSNKLSKQVSKKNTEAA